MNGKITAHASLAPAEVRVIDWRMLQRILPLLVFTDHLGETPGTERLLGVLRHLVSREADVLKAKPSRPQTAEIFSSAGAARLEDANTADSILHTFALSIFGPTRKAPDARRVVTIIGKYLRTWVSDEFAREFTRDLRTELQYDLKEVSGDATGLLSKKIWRNKPRKWYHEAPINETENANLRQVWARWFDETKDPLPRKLRRAVQKQPSSFWERDSLAVVSALADVLELVATLETQPEPLPAQDLGAHFSIEDGTISLSPNPNTGDVGDLGRLRSFHPLVVESLVELLDSIPALGAGSNDPYNRLRRQAEQYLNAVQKDLEQIDFGLLFGLGSMLQNRLDADLKRSVESDLVALSDRQRSALKDFQDQHGPFITASSEGLRHLAAAERVERNPDQERAFAADMDTLADILRTEPGLVTDDVVFTLKDAAGELGTGKQSDRASVYASGTARNFVIVAFAGALMATMTGVGLAFGPVGGVVGGTASLAVLEATKRSGAFRELSEPLTHAMDRAKAANYSAFTEKAGPVLRRIAGGRPEMQWLHNYLDWLEERGRPH